MFFDRMEGFDGVVAPLIKEKIMSRPGLTAEQVLASVKKLQAQGLKPTQREIEDETCGSFSTIRKHLDHLHATGELRLPVTLVRGLREALDIRTGQLHIVIEYLIQELDLPLCEAHPEAPDLVAHLIIQARERRSRSATQYILEEPKLLPNADDGNRA